MLQEELLKNISTISQYFKSEELSDDDKQVRKELSELRQSLIPNALDVLSFNRFII